MLIYEAIIDKYYETGSPVREILFRHSMQVADYAIEILEKKGLALDRDLVMNAAMLHDIGIYRTHAPSIGCLGAEHYIRHGIIGAQILRSEGCCEEIARVAERHTGAGLTRRDIVLQNLPLPRFDYVPETLLEQLVCYADKFFSKSGEMRQKPLDKVIDGMRAHGQDSYERFMEMHSMFEV